MIWRVVGDSHYRLADPERGIELDLNRVRRDRHELVGELTVTCEIKGARTVEGVLSSGSFNVSSTRARSDRAKQLRERACTNGSVDWDGLLEDLCLRVVKADRNGSPSLLLRDVPPPAADATIDVDGLRLHRDHPMVLFGDGGTCKSYLALHLAGQLARQGIGVLYADWELSAGEHRQRLGLLFGGDMPPVRYLRCDRPLAFEVDRILRQRTQYDSRYIVCDSISFGCDGPPEAAEVAGRYFQALRQIGVGSLLLAHTNKSDQADQKPFGSAFWHNGARSTWFLKRAEDSGAADTAVVAAYNKKSNLGPLRPAVGFSIRFAQDVTSLTRVDVADTEELAKALPLRERIRTLLRRQPMTLAALAEDLGAPVDTVDRTVRRHKQMFQRLTGTEDGIHRIGLVTRRMV